MTIWFENRTSLDDIKVGLYKGMVGHLGIEFEELGEDYLKASMPVDERTKQPYGILHGGASCVLAETLGSVASRLCLDPEKEYPVGIEINANHLRQVSSGRVTGIATPIRIGKSMHVWEIHITDDSGKLSAVSRLTVKVMKAN
jgi:1,4-dihydroxy-2-naphthoyl-CoA hydrolase